MLNIFVNEKWNIFSDLLQLLSNFVIIIITRGDDLSVEMVKTYSIWNGNI